MLQVPLCRKLLDDLDDVDCSFKCAQLFKYLQDMTIKLFDSLSATDSDSNVSSISSVSSVSSALSFDSDDESSSQPSLSLLFSDIKEMYYLATQAKINNLHQEILTSRVLQRNPAIKKASQLHLLEYWHTSNLSQYRRRVHVDPNTFNGIVNKIQGHKIFHNNSNTPQALVKVQLAIFLFCAGHYSNAASSEAIGLWCYDPPQFFSSSSDPLLVTLSTAKRPLPLNPSSLPDLPPLLPSEPSKPSSPLD